MGREILSGSSLEWMFILRLPIPGNNSVAAGYYFDRNSLYNKLIMNYYVNYTIYICWIFISLKSSGNIMKKFPRSGIGLVHAIIIMLFW